jgi:3-methylcrotonyl-CoA carboxylase alpha subunit
VKKTYLLRVGAEEFEVTVGEAERGLRVTLGGVTHHADAAEIAPGWYSLVVDGRPHDLGVGVQDAGAGPGSSTSRCGGGGRPGNTTRGRWVLLVDGETYTAEVGRHSSGGPAGQAASGRTTGGVRAPMPGLVVALQVAEGAEVEAGQALVIMEAMKMQMEIRAPVAGRVRQVHVASGQEITGGQLLITIE